MIDSFIRLEDGNRLVLSELVKTVWIKASSIPLEEIPSPFLFSLLFYANAADPANVPETALIAVERRLRKRIWGTPVEEMVMILSFFAFNGLKIRNPELRRKIRKVESTGRQKNCDSAADRCLRSLMAKLSLKTEK